MTGYPDHNFPAFNEAARELRAAGYQVLNPADTGEVDGWEWADYLRIDIISVARSDGIALLPGWEASAGADFEVDIAKRLLMPCLPWRLWLASPAPVIRPRATQLGALRKEQWNPTIYPSHPLDESGRPVKAKR